MPNIFSIGLLGCLWQGVKLCHFQCKPWVAITTVVLLYNCDLKSKMTLGLAISMEPAISAAGIIREESRYTWSFIIDQLLRKNAVMRHPYLELLQSDPGITPEWSWNHRVIKESLQRDHGITQEWSWNHSTEWSWNHSRVILAGITPEWSWNNSSVIQKSLQSDHGITPEWSLETLHSDIGWNHSRVIMESLQSDSWNHSRDIMKSLQSDHANHSRVISKCLLKTWV